ncbi:hypothetical protein [Mycolicibacterium obuense]
MTYFGNCRESRQNIAGSFDSTPGVCDASSNLFRDGDSRKWGEMTTIATKFQVTVAAAAVAAGAAFVPVAANAAPQIQLPAAPSFADLPLQPKGPVYIITATSVQLVSVFLKQSAASQERRSSRLEAYAAAHPDTFFGQLAATRAAQIRSAQAITNNVTFDFCIGGNSVGIGPYGTVTGGSC